MTEILQEERALPKNIKQIGAPDIGDRIYIENRAYQTIHPQNVSAGKMVYVLLGSLEKDRERQCIFIKAAIALEEIAFDGDVPVWNDDSWAYLYRKLNHAYDDLVITGWAFDVCGQMPELTVAVEKIHRTYFGGAHQVLYLLDTLQNEDSFYSVKNGVLKKRDGYYIYYEKGQEEPRISVSIETEEQEQARTAQEKEETAAGTAGVTGSYRTYMKQKEQKKGGFISYVMSAAMLLVICGLGVTAYQNHTKMNAMEAAILQMNHGQVEATETAGQVQVENVAGNIVPEQGTETAAQENIPETEMAAADQAEQTEEGSQAETAETDSASAQEPEQTESAETMSEAGQYLAQGYYIVQKGDSLVGICRKIYQTTAVMDKICEANGIDNPYAIYEGQYLTLPN